MLWGILTEVVLLLLLIYTPFLARIFGLAPLGLREWALLAVFPPAMLMMEEARKWIVRMRLRTL